VRLNISTIYVFLSKVPMLFVGTKSKNLLYCFRITEKNSNREEDSSSRQKTAELAEGIPPNRMTNYSLYSQPPHVIIIQLLRNEYNGVEL
jgi:hypothetical protein